MKREQKYPHRSKDDKAAAQPERCPLAAGEAISRSHEPPPKKRRAKTEGATGGSSRPEMPLA